MGLATSDTFHIHASDNDMDLSQFKSDLSLWNKVLRTLWGLAWLLLFRPTPRPLHVWRRWVLRLFGARIGRGVRIDNSARIFYPPNLELGDQVVIGPAVDLYCVAPIQIAANSMVSQYAYLCAATHDHNQPHLPLVARPIRIGTQVWVCARAFIGPGVEIGDRTIVGACGVVVKSLSPGVIAVGNPARVIKARA